jgi:nitrite reductase/ring-hydroxylating ferredoxin subunit
MTAPGWFVVLPANELALGAIAWVQLAGQELAVWRDASGGVNAWENRCPHRGVRLTLGDNLGPELRCRYHGWRFAAGSAICTAIPARPGHTPSATLAARTYASREASGFIWVNLAGNAGEPYLALDEHHMTAARSVVVHAPVADVAAAVAEIGDVVLALSPMTETATVVHAAFPRALSGDSRSVALREHDRRLRALRDRLERAATAP